MKGRIILLIITVSLLGGSESFGQYYIGLEDVIADSSILSKERYLLPPNDSMKLMEITSIDRDNKVVWTQYFQGIYGMAYRKVVYNDDWKPVKCQRLRSDSSIAYQYRFKYNDKNQLVNQSSIGRSSHDNYEHLHLNSNTNFTYNKKGLRAGFVGVRYIDGDSTRYINVKSITKYDRNRRLKKQKSYETKEGAKKYKLVHVYKVKYSNSGDFLKRKSIQKSIQLKSKSIDEAFYDKDGFRVKSVEYIDKKATRFAAHKYSDGLIVESKYIDHNPETNLNFSSIMKYRRLGDKSR